MEAEPRSKLFLIVEDSMPTAGCCARAWRKMMKLYIVVGRRIPIGSGIVWRIFDPQIITLDIVMPQLDDLNTEGLLQKDHSHGKAGRHVHCNQFERQGAWTAMNYLSYGAIAYLEKPFVNFDQLREKLYTLYPHSFPEAAPARIRYRPEPGQPEAAVTRCLRERPATMRHSHRPSAIAKILAAATSQAGVPRTHLYEDAATPDCLDLDLAPVKKFLDEGACQDIARLRLVGAARSRFRSRWRNSGLPRRRQGRAESIFGT